MRNEYIIACHEDVKFYCTSDSYGVNSITQSAFSRFKTKVYEEIRALPEGEAMDVLKIIINRDE